MNMFFFFFFQAEDGIRDVAVTGVQTCALPISALVRSRAAEYPCGNWKLRREVWHGAHGSVRFDPGDLRMVGGEIFSRANQTKDDRQARKDDCRCGETQGAGPRTAGAGLWPLLLCRAASAAGRDDQARSWRA